MTSFGYIPLLAYYGEPSLIMRLAQDPLIVLPAFVLLWLVPVAGLCYGVYFFISLPLRRRERAALFLDLVETALQQGRSVEQTLVEISHSREPGLGVRFHLLAAHLENGRRLADALEAVPRFLPPQINAMLKVGSELGDLRRVLPACRQLLKDGVSQTSAAQNFLLLFAVVPAAPLVFTFVMVYVAPRFQEIFKDMMPGALLPPITNLFFGLFHILITLQLVLFCFTQLLAFCYVGGPRLKSWLGRGLNPVLDRLLWLLPWRRHRMQRDFAAMLAVLVDAGVPEPRALQLAAECTASDFFLRRAQRVADDLRSGLPLTEAVQRLDSSGEFRWRLENARHSPGGFTAALAGWLDSLEARAFQTEQVAAQVVTAAMVLLNGAIVATFAVAMFAPFISLIDNMTLW